VHSRMSTDIDARCSVVTDVDVRPLGTLTSANVRSGTNSLPNSVADVDTVCLFKACLHKRSVYTQC